MQDLWPAPQASDPLDYTVTVPGSKSITNRAFILAALADSPSVLRRPLVSRDTDLMSAALRAMGIGVEASADANTGEGRIVITPGPLRGADIDCGLAGTVMRFLPPVAALADAPVRFDGDAQARVRPMHTLLDALRALGVEVEGDALPFTVSTASTSATASTGPTGGVPAGGTVTIDASASSQFVSGLLLSGARFADGIVVRHEGGQLPSMPHIDMTVSMLRAAGVTVDEQELAGGAYEWCVAPGPIAGREWDIEPDLSNATPFLAAAAVAGGRVGVTGWPEETTQPGAHFVDILSRMGNPIVERSAGDDKTLSVTFACTADGRPALHGIDLDMGDIGELTPTVAALCALADSPSRLTGIAHLRGHETNRLAALAAEINALGGNVTELDDGLLIEPAPLHGGVWHSYADHRMATAGAIIGLAVPGVEVENIATTAKTLPDFAAMWEALVNKEESASGEAAHG